MTCAKIRGGKHERDATGKAKGRFAERHRCPHGRGETFDTHLFSGRDGVDASSTWSQFLEKKFHFCSLARMRIVTECPFPSCLLSLCFRGLVCRQIEVNLRLLGCTAIEDKLQLGVGPTVEALQNAGVKVRYYIQSIREGFLPGFLFGPGTVANPLLFFSCMPSCHVWVRRTYLRLWLCCEPKYFFRNYLVLAIIRRSSCLDYRRAVVDETYLGLRYPRGQHGSTLVHLRTI